MAVRRFVVVFTLSGCGVLVLGAVAWLCLHFIVHGLQEGKGQLDQTSDCRTSLAKTTGCQGEDTSFQECHYHFRADGIPDAKVCAAFLAWPQADPAAASAVENTCPETLPSGWENVPCENYGLAATMVCFHCFDGSRPEAARRLLQAFDPSCEHGIVLKSCNEALPQEHEAER